MWWTSKLKLTSSKSSTHYLNDTISSRPLCKTKHYLFLILKMRCIRTICEMTWLDNIKFKGDVENSSLYRLRYVSKQGITSSKLTIAWCVVWKWKKYFVNINHYLASLREVQVPWQMLSTKLSLFPRRTPWCPCWMWQRIAMGNWPTSQENTATHVKKI